MKAYRNVHYTVNGIHRNGEKHTLIAGKRTYDGALEMIANLEAGKYHDLYIKNCDTGEIEYINPEQLVGSRTHH